MHAITSHASHSILRRLYNTQLDTNSRAPVCIIWPFVDVLMALDAHLGYIINHSSRTIRSTMAGSSRSQRTGPSLLLR